MKTDPKPSQLCKVAGGKSIFRTGEARPKMLIPNCPLTCALNIIGGKWRLPIIRPSGKIKTLRYNEMKRRIDGITNMVLAQALKELEEYGLIVRTQYLEIPPRVEYSLSEVGKALVPSLQSLASWGKQMQKSKS